MTPTPEKPATETTEVNPFDSDGKVLDTYNVEPPNKSYGPVDVGECAEPSAYGASTNTIACGSSALGADACWAEQGRSSIVCASLPWTNELQRIQLTGPPAETPNLDDPEPLAIETDDGSRYRHRNGPGDYTRDDGLIDIYRCVDGPCLDKDGLPFVLSAESEPTVDQTTAPWTVRLGSNTAKPEKHAVVRAWYITHG